VEPRLADGAASHSWRVALAIRLGMGAAILATGAIALISTAMQDDHPISDPLTMIAIYAALWWFGAIRPAVWLSPDELVVRNPLRTHRIARDNVVSARPGSFGVVIIRRDGRPCTAWALYKPKIAKDRAASLITYWAQTRPSSIKGRPPRVLTRRPRKARPGGALSTSWPPPASPSPSPFRPYSWPGPTTLSGCGQSPASSWSSLSCRSASLDRQEMRLGAITETPQTPGRP
jgi:hypothetical protein